MGDSIIIVLISVAGMIISGLGGALIGSIIAPKLNHNYRMQQLKEEHEKRLDYMKKEKIFERKLRYFEEVSESIENEIDKIFLIKEQLKENLSIKELPNLTCFYKDKCELYFNSFELLKEMNELGNMGIEMNDLVLDFSKKKKEKNYIKEIESLCSKFVDKKVGIIDLMKKELKI